MIAGVAGKYCAGKDTVVHILQSHGFMSIDVDKLGHVALQQEQEAVVRAFGRRVLSADGGVDRKKLGAIVFANNRARKRLEAIVHPAMVAMVEDFIAEHRGERIVINAALLFYMGLHRKCDLVFWVTAPLLKRMRRARSRDKLPWCSLIKRFWAQRKLTLQLYGRDVDIYTVNNSGSRDALQAGVVTILAEQGV
jgi:dephospho-CoA kinase